MLAGPPCDLSCSNCRSVRQPPALNDTFVSAPNAGQKRSLFPDTVVVFWPTIPILILQGLLENRVNVAFLHIMGGVY